MDLTTNQSLEIRIHGVDGSKESFVQEDPVLAKGIISSLNVHKMFSDGKIIIAGYYSLTAFVTSRVTRVDFLAQDLSLWEFPVGIADMVELEEMEFRTRINPAETIHMDKREQHREPGDFLVAFVDIELSDGSHIYCMMEVVVEFEVERLKRLHYLLSGPSLPVRLRCGGISILNLANLVRFTAFPGPPKPPLGTWPAHHKVSASIVVD